jgi:hypothetical protein
MKIMNLKSMLLLMGCSIALLVSSCASYTIQPVSADQLNKDWKSGEAKEGFVFYQSELYFLVTPAPAGKPDTNAPAGQAGSSGLTVTPVYLPNPQKPYRVSTFNFLAKSDFTFNFKDGWQLQSIADKADNTTVANTLAGELGTVLSTVMKGGLFTGSQPQKAFLLHPIYDKTGAITGFTPIDLPLQLPPSN